MNEPRKSSGSLHFSVVAGMVSAAARFLPVPFVDDIVRDQCRRLVVSRTLAANESKIRTKDLKPYYGSGGGCLSGCLGMIAKAPLKLLLFPIRKVIAIVTSVRGVPLEIVRMVLLSRTLERCLEQGRLSGDETVVIAMRAAFEESFSRMDFRVVRAAMSDALASVNGWKTSAIDAARQVADEAESIGDGIQEDSQVESGANQIEAILNRPETLSLFADFDKRFDIAMQQMQA